MGVGCVVKDHSDSERERKEGFYLTTHSTHLITVIWHQEGSDLFSDALNTFYFTVIWCRTYGKGPHI